MTKTFAIALALCTALTAPALATTFDTRADFLAAGGTYTDHTSITPDFTVTNGPGATASVTTSSGFTNLFAGDPYIILSGDENFNLDVTFATSIFAFGMDIYEPTSSATFNGCNVPTCVESTFALTFLSSGSVLDTITISPDNNILDFIGYSNAAGFDRIEVRETAGSNDNEMFGNLITSSTALAPVPLPAGGALLLTGLGGFAALRRRKS